MNFSIAQALTTPNKKVQALLPILNTGTSIPVTVITGKEAGPTLLITAGVHACEYVGILTALELAREIKPEGLKGNLIIAPLANRQAFWSKAPYIVPEDQKNLNRVFPGSATGTLSEQIAWVITDEILPYITRHIDLHGGDVFEDLTAYVYYAGIPTEEVATASRQMAEAVNVPYMVKSFAKSGAYNSSALHGVPAILMERGCSARCSREDVELMKEDVRNILRTLQVIDEPLSERRWTPQEVENVIYLDSDYSGCWISKVHAGKFLQRGEELGSIQDIFGNQLHTYYAEQDGVVLYCAAALAVANGDPLVAYGHLSNHK